MFGVVDARHDLYMAASCSTRMTYAGVFLAENTFCLCYLCSLPAPTFSCALMLRPLHALCRAHTKTCWHAGVSMGLAREEADCLATLLYQHISGVELNRFLIAITCRKIVGMTRLALSVCETEQKSGRLDCWCHNHQSSRLLQ